MCEGKPILTELMHLFCDFSFCNSYYYNCHNFFRTFNYDAKWKIKKFSLQY